MKLAAFKVSRLSSDASAMFAIGPAIGDCVTIRSGVQFYWLILGVLTVWRITHFLQAEDGPWDMVIRLRRFVGEGFWGRLLDCFYCLSVWIAAPIAFLIGQSWPERALLWPSLSAAAILCERVTNKTPGVPPAPFAEEPGEDQDHGMLRTEKAADERPDDARPSGE
jgi:hypothetical protein